MKRQNKTDSFYYFPIQQFDTSELDKDVLGDNEVSDRL